jgi:signal-transduction protein with cAMP-binding, CBS, and nucleotidyltransferase domain
MKILDAAETIDSLGVDFLKELSTFGALSEEAIVDMMANGVIRQYSRGEYITRLEQIAQEFQVLLRGKVAFYKSFSDCAVLTRTFNQGEQLGFDLMIGLTRHQGTDVMLEDSLLLDVSSEQFFKLRIDFPADFGLLMINLSRELAREIEILEDVIGRGTGWREEA